MAAAFAFFAGISLPLGRLFLVAALALELRSRAGRAALARAAKSPSRPTLKPVCTRMSPVRRMARMSSSSRAFGRRYSGMP